MFLYLIYWCFTVTGQTKLYDSVFVKALRINYPNCVSKDGTVDTICAANARNTYLYIDDVNLKSIEGIRYFKNLDSLEITDTNLEKLPLLPKGLIYLACNHNRIVKVMEPLPENIHFIALGANRLESFPKKLGEELNTLILADNNELGFHTDLPKSLVYLDISRVKIEDNKLSLPNNLKDLYISGCHLNALPNKLPKKLELLICNDNKIKEVKTLPKKLKVLDISQNRLIHFPHKLPKGLITLIIFDNVIKKTPRFIPDTVFEINASGNCFNELEINSKKYKPSWRFTPNRINCE